MTATVILSRYLSMNQKLRANLWVLNNGWRNRRIINKLSAQSIQFRWIFNMNSVHGIALLLAFFRKIVLNIKHGKETWNYIQKVWRELIFKVINITKETLSQDYGRKKRQSDFRKRIQIKFPAFSRASLQKRCLLILMLQFQRLKSLKQIIHHKI